MGLERLEIIPEAGVQIINRHLGGEPNHHLNQGALGNTILDLDVVSQLRPEIGIPMLQVEVIPTGLKRARVDQNELFSAARLAQLVLEREKSERLIAQDH